MSKVEFTNYGTIYLTNNQVYHVKIKHVDMRFHKIVELFASRQILLENIHISEIATDTLIKALLELVNTFSILFKRCCTSAFPRCKCYEKKILY